MSYHQTAEYKAPLHVLLLGFLKVGCLSFGGHMAMVSVIKNQMVDREGILSDVSIIEGMTLASILPGPFAVNFVSYLGHRYYGLIGGLMSMITVLLPSFILMAVATILYFNFQSDIYEYGLHSGVLPAMVAIVLAVAINMTRDYVKKISDFLLIIVSAIVLILTNQVWVVPVLFLIGGIVGRLNATKTEGSIHQNIGGEARLDIQGDGAKSLIIFLILGLSTLWIVYKLDHEYYELMSTFSGMSVTLFGGGYVFISVMQEVLVDTLHWLSIKEYADGIALGQITPGPIMVSTFFVGYKKLGVMGGTIATISMFVPSAFLAILSGSLFDKIRHTYHLQNAIIGIRLVAIGMIYFAGYKFSSAIEWEWQSLLILVISSILILVYKAKPILVVPVAMVLGILIN